MYMDGPQNEYGYVEMCNDFAIRMKKKSSKIVELQKIIFMLYGLIRRGLEVEDNALFEEARGVISEYFDEEFDMDDSVPSHSLLESD